MMKRLSCQRAEDIIMEQQVSRRRRSRRDHEHRGQDCDHTAAPVAGSHHRVRQRGLVPAS